LATQTQPKPYTSSVVEPRPRFFFSTSIGTKMLIGATGLMLIVYLILHLLGNLLIFLGPATFNAYAHLLISNPLVVPVEIGLAAVFFIHVYKALTNWWANRQARPVGYYKRQWGGKPSRKTIASSTMIFSGIIIFAFIVIHLLQFRFGAEYEFHTATGEEIRDIYRLEMEVFGNIVNVVFYVFAMVVIGFHLWHGFWSGFQSLGASHSRFTPAVITAGKVLAFIIAGGFVFIPIWIFMFGSGA
jgi:succinate dehydrogenase / fumarate reductase, cytochrome b subunit